MDSELSIQQAAAVTGLSAVNVAWIDGVCVRDLPITLDKLLP